MRTEYNIYCDESCHLENDGIKPMALGSIWCPKSERENIFQRLRDLKTKHNLPSTCELKWNAVSPSKIKYYHDVVDYFFDNSDLHFRTLIVPDKTLLNHKAFHQTHDNFYYKMYFDLLKTILDPKCAYEIYLDIKDTQGQEKVERLQQFLCNSAYDFERRMLRKVQQVRSHEVELIQLTDFFTGAICYAHRGLETSLAKQELLSQIRKRSGYSLLKSTLYKEDKVNIFVWKGKEL